MSNSLPFRNYLLLSTVVAAGCLTLIASEANAATACAPGKVHDKHGHCVVPAHRKATAKSAAVAPGYAPAAAPVMTTSAAAPAATLSRRSAEPQNENIVVTGSILRNPNLQGASPVTHLTAQDLKNRGLTTVASALQMISANGSGNLPANFSGNGAFASGATGASLRGLTTDSTVVLIDGQRSAYYPLADDGERNFVDLNSIPMATVQTIDVEKDGASASYGADAVAGVINIITRKQIQGFEGNAEGGVSGHGDAGHQRLYATYGYGDLNRQGFNVYVSGEYQNDDLLYNSQRGYPYNSGNLTGIGGTDGNPGATTVGATTSAVVRPVTVSPAGTITNAGGYSILGGSCQSGQIAHTTSAGSYCEQNTVGNYRIIQPEDRRINGTIHFTGKLSDRAQVTSQFTYAQNRVYYTGTPVTIRSASSSNDISFANILLPARLANGQLNPNDPFAAQGEAARIYYRFGDIVPTTTDLSQVYRASIQLSGWEPSSWGGDWRYNAGFVGMSSDLKVTDTGYETYATIRNAINNGTYNFVNPSLNTSAERAAIAPTAVQQSNSQLYAFDVTGSKDLFHLPGGMASLGIGGQLRSESLNDPSINPDDKNNVANQYLVLNGFSAQGARRIGAGYFEVGLPLLKMLSVDVAGRYDHYSEGFGHFSPKVGVVFKPIKQFTLRGTFSKGFRAPSFAETNSNSIGYISITPPAAFAAAHGNDAYGSQTSSVGLNTVGNPNLQPEIATNFTGGFIFQPKPWLSFTTDYYHIKKTHYITLADYSTSLASYFAGGSPSNVVAGTPDPDHPGALALPSFIDVGYINAAKMVTSGIDMELSAKVPLPNNKYLRDVSWTSTGEATYVINYNVNYPGTGVEKYAGTLGPDNITSASGTPRWRANWANTFTYKKAALTLTMNYTSGYKLTAEDITGPGTADDCSQAQQGFAGDPLRCHVGSFLDFDMNFSYQLTKSLQLYANMFNIGNTKAPLDTGTYGGYQYNPSWAASGILGRDFTFGVLAKF